MKITKDNDGSFEDSFIRYIQEGKVVTFELIRRLEIDQGKAFDLGSKHSRIECELLEIRDKSHALALIAWYRAKLSNPKQNPRTLSLAEYI